MYKEYAEAVNARLQEFPESINNFTISNYFIYRILPWTKLKLFGFRPFCWSSFRKQSTSLYTWGNRIRTTSIIITAHDTP